MHDDGQGQSTNRITDPLRGAPPPGRWVLLHGPLASAIMDLARGEGQATTTERVGGRLPPMPAGFPPPAGDSLGAFLLENGGRRFFLQGEVSSGYVSCFLCHLPEGA